MEAGEAVEVAFRGAGKPARRSLCEGLATQPRLSFVFGGFTTGNILCISFTGLACFASCKLLYIDLFGFVQFVGFRAAAVPVAE